MGLQLDQFHPIFAFEHDSWEIRGTLQADFN